jgi:hypothetical protein
MSLHPHFQHVLTDFGKIRYKRSAHISELRENVRSEVRTSEVGTTDSTYTRLPWIPPPPSQVILKLETVRLGLS